MITLTIETGPHAGEVIQATTLEAGLRALRRSYPRLDREWWSYVEVQGVRAHHCGFGMFGESPEPWDEPDTFTCRYCHGQVTWEEYRTEHVHGGCLAQEDYLMREVG